MKQQIPDPGFRVATGPVKFGNDWCGYFYRGDETLAEDMRRWARLLRNEETCDREMQLTIADRLDREADKIDECQE
jgi:hypothetical protein